MGISNPIEPCIYSKWVSDELLLLAGVYVDDFCIISDSQDEVDKLKAFLGAEEVYSNKWFSLTINHDVIAGTLSISSEINISISASDMRVQAMSVASLCVRIEGDDLAPPSLS